MMHRPESHRFSGEPESGPRQPKRCRFDILIAGDESNRRDQRQGEPGPLPEEPATDPYNKGRVSLYSTETRPLARIWTEPRPPRICLAALRL